MRKARFKVYGRFDGATQATVEIERGSALVTVRPYRRRRTYTLPLATVAEIVVWRIIQAEVRERRVAKGFYKRRARGRVAGLTQGAR